MMQAKAFATVSVPDPLTGGDVEVQLFHHENGGIFGIDSSYFSNGGDFELVDEHDGDSDAIILDPFVAAHTYGSETKVRLTF